MEKVTVTWTFEQTCTNEISIIKDGVKVASVVNEDDDNTQDDFDTAQFIVDSCNRAEKQGYK